MGIIFGESYRVLMPLFESAVEHLVGETSFATEEVLVENEQSRISTRA
jgi:hypothetical protein